MEEFNLPCYIYTLNDPITNDIRYVGKTINPASRYNKHINESFKPKYKKESWIKSLLIRGLRPTMDIIDVVEFDDSDLIEEMYIQQFKYWGLKLTNIQSKAINGNYRHNESTRLKISEKLKGKKHSKETILKRKQSVSKAWESESLRKEQSIRTKKLNNLGIIGTKGKVSKKKGIPLKEETKIKLSKSLLEYYSKNESTKKWNPINKEEIIKDYLNSKISLKDMSSKYCVNRNMITRLMNREGVQLRNNGSKKINKDVLTKLICLGLKNKEIAVELGVSLAQVEKYKRIYSLTKSNKK